MNDSVMLLVIAGFGYYLWKTGALTAPTSPAAPAGPLPMAPLPGYGAPTPQPPPQTISQSIAQTLPPPSGEIVTPYAGNFTAPITPTPPPPAPVPVPIAPGAYINPIITPVTTNAAGQIVVAPPQTFPGAVYSGATPTDNSRATYSQYIPPVVQDTIYPSIDYSQPGALNQAYTQTIAYAGVGESGLLTYTQWLYAMGRGTNAPGFYIDPGSLTFPAGMDQNSPMTGPQFWATITPYLKHMFSLSGLGGWAV